jgi:hypothetical protein
MKTYWDSSALLNALVSAAVAKAFEQGEHVSRSHAYAETFSHLTGKGIPLKHQDRIRFAPDDAARMIRGLHAKLTVRDLDCAETVQAISDAAKLGVQGARIHDLLHARSAVLSKADQVWTRNISGFANLTGTIPVSWPQ